MFIYKALTGDEILKHISNIPDGYKDPSDDFFKKCTLPYKKLGVLTLIEENDLHAKHHVFCNVLGCKKIFETVFEYESHYNSLHRHICFECKKKLPTAHLLDLHISETHDMFFAAQAERKPMYACFLAECSIKSMTPEERKDHCIREHKLPSNFRFETSNKMSKRKTKDVDTQPEGCQDKHKNEDKSKTGHNFYTFGHHRVRTFERTKKQKPRDKNINEKMDTSPIEDNKMVTDLLESLPNREN